jgi:hypothetical protein
LSRCSREAYDVPKRCGARPALCTAVSRSSVDLHRRSDHIGTCSAATARSGPSIGCESSVFDSRQSVSVSAYAGRKPPAHPRTSRCCARDARRVPRERLDAARTREEVGCARDTVPRTGSRVPEPKTVDTDDEQLVARRSSRAATAA